MNAPSISILEEASRRLHKAAVLPEEPVLPLSVEAYHALREAGILHSGDPVELLEGFLVPKMTKGPRHAAAKRRFLRQLTPLISAPYFIDSQEAMTSADSEPEPDIYVVQGPEQKFDSRHPGPGEVEMVVEISESSLHRDRNWKKRIYARAGVATYWIVNLVNDGIEVFSKPAAGRKKPVYGDTAIYSRGDRIAVMLGGKKVGEIVVSDILGEPVVRRRQKGG